MGSLMGSFFGNTANKSADETMALTSLAGTATSAASYLTATLESTTPEVRRLFNEYCTQSIMANESLTALALKKGWISPYNLPKMQLQNSIEDAQLVLGSNQ